MSFTKNLIRQAAQDVVRYIDEKHAVDVDRYDIQELLFIHLRDFLEIANEEYCDLFDVVDEEDDDDDDF